MSNTGSPSILARTVGLLGRHPGALLLLQLPVALTALVEPSPSESAPSLGLIILIVSILFPIFVFLSTLSSTATLAFVQSKDGPSPLSPGQALKQTLKSIRAWGLTGLVLALLTLPAAFSMFLIPVAVYFSAIYSFAPFLAMEDPKTPLSLHFSRSKKLAGKAFGMMLALAGVLMIIEFGLAFSGSDLGARMGTFSANPLIRSALSLGTQFTLALSTSLLANPLLAVVFLKLRSEP